MSIFSCSKLLMTIDSRDSRDSARKTFFHFYVKKLMIYS